MVLLAEMGKTGRLGRMESVGLKVPQEKTASMVETASMAKMERTESTGKMESLVVMAAMV